LKNHSSLIASLPQPTGNGSFQLKHWGRVDRNISNIPISATFFSRQQLFGRLSECTCRLVGGRRSVKRTFFKCKQSERRVCCGDSSDYCSRGLLHIGNSFRKNIRSFL